MPEEREVEAFVNLQRALQEAFLEILSHSALLRGLRAWTDLSPASDTILDKLMPLLLREARTGDTGRAPRGSPVRSPAPPHTFLRM